MNHFAKVCMKETQFRNKIRLVQDDGEEVLALNAIGDNSTYKDKVMAAFLIRGNKISMQVDSGATCNVIPKRHVPDNVEINYGTRRLSLYGNKATVDGIGVCNIVLKNPKNHRKYDVKFVVVHEDCTPLIGARMSQIMKILKVQHKNFVVGSVSDGCTIVGKALSKVDVINAYPKVFKGRGKMPGKVHLQVDPAVEPVVMPPRRVPLAVKEKLKSELTRLEGLGYIEKVVEPTEWVSGLVTVQKPNGNIRVCIDPLYLNKALKRGHYPLPVIEDVLPHMSKAQVFTKADCKEGFLQIELDDESTRLTTFQTPWGRYKWNRMPFGISPAPEIFQQQLDCNLEGLEGVFKIADDIIITGHGADMAEANDNHDENLKAFLDRCSERGIRLNEEKFDYKSEQIKFMGHVLSKDGLKIDPKKVEAIKNMPRPDSVEAIQRFVGMVKYLGKFLPRLSDISEPLRRLTHKGAEFLWGQEQEVTFQEIKDLVSRAPVLRYFDEKCPTEGQGDASQYGLGYALLQDGQPVSYASRALTPAETRYSQIEKELLAQVFGLERHHDYVYGRKVTLLTDHKPLVDILSKPLATAPKRLQRLMIRLSQYDVEIKYIPGTEMYLADTLSRAFLENGDRSGIEEEVERIHLIDAIPVSQNSQQEIRESTARDTALNAVMEYIASGWPSTSQTCTPEARPFFSIRHELTSDNGIVFKGLRCVIPADMRVEIRKKLHASHTGLESTLQRARECVYWPNMTSDMKDYLSRCEACNIYASSQRKETLIHHELPTRPWQKIGCDIFSLDGRDYLCTVDYFSDYWEIDNLTGKKDAPAVITRLKRHFANHGIPETFQSDNGPPFNSHDFNQFASVYGFEHTTSSPEYPQSNGKAENAVKIAKQLLKKTKKGEEDFYMSLLVWRNTPTVGLNSSPAQRLFGRRLRNNLPIASVLLKPKLQTDTNQRKEKNREKQAHYYNRGAKDLPELKVGDTVRVKPKKHARAWESAIVLEKVGIRSYSIRTERGAEIRRNRRHLRKSNEQFDDNTDLAVDQEPSATDNPQNTPPTPTESPPNMTSSSDNSGQSSEQFRRSQRQTKQPAYLQDYKLN
eukprot:XP_011661130.1 PREDICTED: uncharacterized protein K02A2.6-like [Strongylocentrotus purpuratus]